MPYNNLRLPRPEHLLTSYPRVTPALKCNEKGKPKLRKKG